MQKDAGKIDLIPPDIERCQCEITSGNFMTLGGTRQTKRCTEKPVYIATEVLPGEDGQCGAMSLCKGCAQEMLRDEDLIARVNLTVITKTPE